MQNLYRVIYLWRGERHALMGTFTVQDANVRVTELRADKWQAWAERL